MRVGNVRTTEEVADGTRRRAAAQDHAQVARGRGPPPDAAPADAVAERKEKLDDDVDAILDDIDEVLESNAEEFVRGLRPEGRPVTSMAQTRAVAGGLHDARELVVR